LSGTAYGNETYRIEFPDGKSINDILGGSISIWCRTFAVNFGEVIVPTALNASFEDESAPELQCSSSGSSQEVSLGVLPTTEHLVTGEVVILSEYVLEVRGFVFDGKETLNVNVMSIRIIDRL
jgi:Electron transfer DM13